MRISRAALLVSIAVSLPFILQLKTVLYFLGYELSVVQNALIGAIVILGIVVWAFLPRGILGEEGTA